VSGRLASSPPPRQTRFHCTPVFFQYVAYDPLRLFDREVIGRASRLQDRWQFLSPLLHVPYSSEIDESERIPEKLPSRRMQRKSP
jgi:hypothetical protein